MKISELKRIIEMSWSKETCYPMSCDVWSIDNPSLGQCAITALVVNDFLGGKIMRCMCGEVSHYYNIINGEVVDLTKEQFNGLVPDYDNSIERTREYVLSNEDTKSRYLKLLNNVRNNFIEFGNYEYKLRDKDNKEYISKIPGTLGGNKKLKIYGKLDCPSALRFISEGKYVKYRVFFESEDVARDAGYRPCAICMKKEYKLWKSGNNEK